MNISFPTTDGEPFWLPNVASIRRHGTSTNTADPPPADVNLTALEPFNWIQTSTGFTVYWPHATRARVLRADGKPDGLGFV